MNLEIQHLAPYLPYKLGFVLESETNSKEPNIQELKTIDPGLKMVNCWMDGKHLTEIKPLLYPFSSLSTRININGKNINPIKELNALVYQFEDAEPVILLIRGFNGVTFEWYVGADSSKRQGVPFVFYQKLFEWHFDVFDLIKKGLAIDISKTFLQKTTIT